MKTQHPYHIPFRRRLRAFTLVELLVVIIIFSLLSSLTVIGIQFVIKATKRANQQRQFEDLTLAIDEYKAKFGEYPPDFSDHLEVMRHVKKRWPRTNYDISYAGFTTFCDDIVQYFTDNNLPNPWLFYIPQYGESWYFSANGVNYNATCCQSRGAHVGALLFWLGGLPDSSGVPAGFSQDPKNPILGSRDMVEKPRFNFGADSILLYDEETEKLRKSQFNTLATMGVATRKVEGVIPVLGFGGSPVVYFTATDQKEGAGAYANPQSILREQSQTAYNNYNLGRMGNATTKYCSYFSNEYRPGTGGNSNIALYGPITPYASSVPKDNQDLYGVPLWHEPERFQLICAGEDLAFGCWGEDATNKPFGVSLSGGGTSQIRCRRSDGGVNGSYFGRDAAFRADKGPVHGCGTASTWVRTTKEKLNLSQYDNDNLVNFAKGLALESELE